MKAHTITWSKFILALLDSLEYPTKLKTQTYILKKSNVFTNYRQTKRKHICFRLKIAMFGNPWRWINLVSQRKILRKRERWKMLITSVMASSKVIGCIFFARDKLFRMEELSVSSGSYFVNDGWFKIKKHSPRHMLAWACLAKECVECIMTYTNSAVTAKQIKTKPPYSSKTQL